MFGEVTEGEELLMKLNDTICDSEHRPYQDIRITHTVVLEDPFDDPPGLLVPDRSPEPTKENLVVSKALSIPFKPMKQSDHFDHL